MFIRPFRLSQALGKFSRQQSSSRDPAAVPSLGLSPAMYYGSGYISWKEFWTLGLVFWAIYLAVLLVIGVSYLKFYLG